MIFETRVPESMANLPSRKVVHWEVEPPRANAAPVDERTCKECGVTYPIFCFGKGSKRGFVWRRLVCKLCVQKKRAAQK